jgi:hypothetical protein
MTKASGMTEGLKNFVNEYFTRWATLNLNDVERLVVDGDSICTQLYRRLEDANWLLGGEYSNFHTAVREFFAEILFAGVQLLVVFSGVEIERPGVDSVHVRGAQFNEAVRKMQGRMGWNAIVKSKVLPLMARAVFVDVIRSLGIEIRVSSGDARRDVAAFANHFKCPVLGADWDFFMFELEAGYLPFDKLSTVIASGFVFHAAKFRAEFGIRDPQLLLLFPVLLGSDRLEKMYAEFDFMTALKKVSLHATCEDYFLTEGSEGTRRNFEILKSCFCNLDLPPDHDLRGDVFSESFADFPEWAARRFTLGCFEPQLLNVHLNKTCLLPSLVEDIKRDSAWLASRSIRQYLYGFVGVPTDGTVQEIIRTKSAPEVINAQVSPCNFDPPLSLKDFAGMDPKAAVETVLNILKCCRLSKEDRELEFDTLEDKWKLPVAATFFWYQTCDHPPVQRHLVKSLLVCFLTCSGDIQNIIIPPLDSITRDTKPDVLVALHAFAQWQCVYFDAMALNYVAREPFPTTSPASLYSGEVAMHYAACARKNVRVDSIIAAGSTEWVLFNKFLYLVTGSGGGGRVGKHAKHQPRVLTPKRPEEAPSLKETNRYALLPDSP